MKLIYLAIPLLLIGLLSTLSPSVDTPLETLTPQNIDRITQLHNWEVNGDIHDIVWSPNGDLFAVAVNNDIYFYDPHNWKKPLRVLRGHENLIWDIAFSPDGKYLVSGSGGIAPKGIAPDNTARVWDVASGNLLLTLPHPQDEQVVESVAFNQTASQVMTVTLKYDTIRLWDMKTGELISTLPIEPIDGGWPRILSSVFSPDSSFYAMGSLHNDLTIWRLGSPLEKIPDLPAYGAELVFSPDSQKFAAANRYGAYSVIHDLTTRNEITTDFVFNMQISALAFSPDGQILAQAGYWQEFSDLTLHFWNPETGQPFFIIGNLAAHIDFLAFNPDGKMLLSANKKGEIGIWGIEHQKTTDQ